VHGIFDGLKDRPILKDHRTSNFYFHFTEF